jgi:hypothetical protein
MQTLALNITTCLALAVVFGTDVFFTVVGRPALARASDPAVLEVMAHLHAVADRRMTIFGVTGLVGTGLLVAFGASARAPAAIALVAQLVWLALYLTIAKPINAQMIAAMRTGTGAPDARALQTRWESILVPRSVLLGTALCSLLLVLTKVG